MPFRRSGPAGRAVRLNLRLTAEEKAELDRLAGDAGITVSALMRDRALGRPVLTRADAQVLRELRRLGGLVKHLHVESRGAYSSATAAALAALRDASDRVAADPGCSICAPKRSP